MKKLFGTDGMRGEAGRFPLDAPTIETVGRSLARQLAERAGGAGRAPRIVLGRDTRESGEWIERAFVAGARAAGAECERAGIITTPGVAFLTRTLPADAGVVISASHNPYHDNGIKIFAPTGRKLDDAAERQIEADIRQAHGDGRDGHERDEGRDEERDEGRDETHASESGAEEIQARGLDAGAEEAAAVLQARYLDYLSESVAPGLRLDNLRLVVDSANGAASQLAPALFERLGAEVWAVGNTPDGRNINQECGSLYVENLRDKVSAAGAHLGVAFDGDADRALFMDASGQVVDGDATLWIMAKSLQARGELAGAQIVATVMSNIGLELALRSRDIEMLRTDVGDKYVLEELLRTGASLGGEQSGHIIFPRASLAGDGMITTLFLLRAMQETGESLEALREGFTRYPQVLVNVRVGEKRPFAEVAEIALEARRTEDALAGQGRLLLRYSGTEPLARVMIEGRHQAEIERLAHALAGVIERALGREK
jgi:phosphoglucosamine mutase